jgi:hypothetical protein
MPDSEGFVHDLLLPDSNTRRFHAGDACQWSPPVPEGEVEPPVAAMIAAHRASIHAPGARARGRFGLDEEGNPIETSALGVGVDPDTGALVPLDDEGNRLVPAEGGGRRPERKEERREERAQERREETEAAGRARAAQAPTSRTPERK